MEKKRLTSRGFETAPTKSEWGLFLAVTAVFFFQYFYFDIAVTTQQGMNFWDCVRSGNLMEFYNVNYGVGALTHFDFGDTSMYYLPLYLVFAVWNLPLWIIENVSGIYAMYSLPCVLWARAITIPFTYLAVITLGKIAARLGMDNVRVRWCQFLFLTSTIFANAVVIIGQYDIISISFMLLGVLGYLEKNDKKFIGWFALAATFKLFALLIFVPLVLQRYKKIWPALWRCLVPLGAVALVRVPFEIYGGRGIAMSTEISYSLVRAALFGMAPFANNRASVFVLLTLALWVWVFFTNEPDEHSLPRRSMWICLAGFCALMFGADCYPYWNLLLLPFLMLLICSQKENFRPALLIEGLMSAIWSISQLFEFSGAFEIRYLLSSFIPKLFGTLPIEANKISPASLLALPDYIASDIVIVLNSAWTLLLAALLFILYPRAKQKTLRDIPEVGRGFVWARAAVGWLIAALPIAIYIAYAV